MTPKENAECDLADAAHTLETLETKLKKLVEVVDLNDTVTASAVESIMDDICVRVEAALEVLREAQEQVESATDHVTDIDEDDGGYEPESDYLAPDLRRMHDMFCARYGYLPDLGEDPWITNMREAMEAAAATADGVESAAVKLQTHTSLALRFP